MTTSEPTPDEGNAQPGPEHEGDDDSVVTPPTYPAYSTPPPEGLPDANNN